MKFLVVGCFLLEYIKTPKIRDVHFERKFSKVIIIYNNLFPLFFFKATEKPLERGGRAMWFQSYRVCFYKGYTQYKILAYALRT